MAGGRGARRGAPRGLWGGGRPDPPVKRLFQAMGVRLVGVPVDAEGLVVDDLPEAARLVYTSPSHQFPLGHALSLSRRLALLRWAERVDAVILEDDYDGE